MAPSSAWSRSSPTSTATFGKALETRFGEVLKEFSKDDENSALSRMINGIEKAQSRITAEFNLAEESSALAKMQKMLLDSIENQTKANAEFQTEVKTTLAALSAQKHEARKGTRHGNVFDDALFEFINSRSQAAGDIAEATGEKTGILPRNKKGDVVVTPGPIHIAAGARIAIEAKQRDKYTLTEARDEIKEARENRQAGAGLFVFSASRAPENLAPLGHYGDDIVSVWDAEDPATAPYIEAALSIARALCCRSRSDTQENAADFEGVEKAVWEIEAQSEGLDSIDKAVQAIDKQTANITERTRTMRERLTKQIGILDDKVAWRSLATDEGDGG